MKRSFRLLPLLPAAVLGLATLSCSRPTRVGERPSLPVPTDADVSPAQPGKRGGVFIEVSPGEPSTFNWLVAEDASSASFLGLLFDGLTSYNPIREEVVPALAKSWEVGADSRTFTFHLREGLTWSDGVPLTADDVLFTFQCVYDPRFPNRNAYDLSVNGKPFLLEKLDRHTVRIRTPEIFAPFLRYMSGVTIMPKHLLQGAYEGGTLLRAWSIFTAQKTPATIASSGAFLLHSYRPGQLILLEANPRYWRIDVERRRLPYIDFLIVKFVKDQNASVVAFASGQTDADTIPPDDVAWVRRGEKIHHYTIHDRGPSTASTFLWFNQNPGRDKSGKPFVAPYKLRWFQDRRFRQAISYGIDREGMVKGILFGRGQPLWGPESPANSKWFNPRIRQYPFDPARAEQLLTEAGFHRRGDGMMADAEDHPVSFTLLTNQENPLRTAMATVFQQNMRALGIEARLQFLDFGALVTKISDSFDYEACLLGLTGGGDPADGMSVFVSKGRLHQWYPSEPQPATPWEARIDSLMLAQLTTLDQSLRKQYWDEVQQILSEELPYIYLVTPNTYAGLRDKWRNVQIPKIGSVVWNLEEVWTP
ncbi:ABC transporter substrate-binding protein [Verrucomicrobium sp. 3C]|uniref:ABC transporter substrate-binding protein n=1 Tax=Verrucomicrobium sp. 3C TaxID=1134055 RepID=UPI00039DA449|nr:ABC transporter substrate-binding protein [Verrucomicrobium sp. 3C]